MNRNRIFSHIAAIGLLVFAVATSASDFCVDNVADLESALLTAQSNAQADRIQLVQGNYSGNFVYTSTEWHGLEILGGYSAGCASRTIDPENTVLSGAGGGNVLAVTAGLRADFTLEGVTLSDGDASADNGGGLMVVCPSDVTLARNILSNNSAATRGGGAYLETNARRVTLTDNRIIDNTNDGLYIAAAFVTLTGNRIHANSSEGVDISASGGLVSMSDNVVSANDGHGANLIAANALLNGNWFEDNGENGASVSAELTATDNRFDRNGGNGIWADRSMTLIGNGFSFNLGTGAYSAGRYSVSIVLEDNEFQGNLDRGVYSVSDYATLENNRFIDNQSSRSDGGGAYLAGSYSKTLINNHFTGNTASGNGGGAYLESSNRSSSTSTLVNNRFEGNFSTDLGGGAYLISHTAATLTNNSFANNDATRGAGLGLQLYSETASTQLVNNLFWNNAALLSADDLWIYNDTDNDGTASPLELMHNDFDQTQPAGLYVTLPISIDPSNLDAVDPLFADELLHLSAGSPLIDAGDDGAAALPATDMDGEARILDAAIDIGADEYSGVVHRYQLGVVKTGNGRVTSGDGRIDCGTSCSADYAPGTQVVFDASPDAGWDFAGWGGACSGTGRCIVQTTSGQTVTARFDQGLCIDSVAGLESALLAAQDNAQPDRIRLVQGSYSGNFVYNSTDRGALEILGGYSAGCASRTVDPANTVLNGAGAGTVLAVTADLGADFTLEGVTLSGGDDSADNGGGLRVVSRSDITLARNVLSNNSSTRRGGGAYLETGARVDLTDNRVVNNTGAGLSIDAKAAFVTLAGNRINTNSSSGVHITGSDSFISLSDNVIGSNSASGVSIHSRNASISLKANTIVANARGAYVYADKAFLIGNQFEDNSGDGAYVDDARLIATNNRFDRNGGNGIWADRSMTLISNSFSFNLGTGAYSAGSFSIVLDDNEFQGNLDRGVYSDSGSATLENNRFIDNQSSSGGGGGAYLAGPYYSKTLINNHFTGNSAGGNGGGAYVDSNGYNYTSTLVNNRFEGNFSTDQGGGAYLISLTTTLTNNSFANNEALHGAGLALELNSETADTDLANNLFWNNAALLSADDLWIDNDPDNDGTASPLELMHNDFDQTQPASLVVTLPISIDPSNLDAVDPLFADDLLHLSDGSPAIDAGNDAASELPATDMDGEARILGAAVDIGADEYSGSVLPLTLSVVTDGTGLGLVTSSPAGIDCGSDCSEPFAPGTVVDLTPNPNAGSILAGWTGCDSTGGDVCRVTMNGDRGVTATFNVFQATLSVNKIGTGGGVIASTPAGIDCGNDCNEVYPIGTAVELTATAGANATFVGWSGACSGSGSCMITMNGDLDVTASFDQIRHDLTINPLGAGTGSVISIPAGIDCGNDCTADFVQGQAVDLTASAAAGSEFVGWSGCDTTNGSLCSLVIGNDRVVSATFDLLVGACASMTIHQTDTTDCPDLRSILSIQDDQGQPVTGLIETDFSLDEDGIARAVQLEAGGERAVGLVIDTSGSLEDTDLANIRQACIDFIGLLSPGDRVAVYQFDYTANLLQDYTSDLSLAIDAINTLVSPGGNTALYDALFMAADDADTIGGSKGVVVLTDGQDNVSNRTVTEAVERAVDAGVPVFTIGFGSADAGVLTDIADRTGGLYYAGVDSDDLQDLLDRLGTVLNSQYVLLWQSGFPDGGRHGIAIEAQVSPSCRISATASYDQAGSPCQTSTCMAERSLPLGYAAELPIPVAVAVRPEDSVQTYALEDIPPAGMAVSNISDAGVLDNGKVKWGPFFDNLDRDLGYNITPPSGTQGSLGWSGLFSHDGVSEPICGDALLPEGLVHPADYGAAGDDWRIEINELTSYTSAWKTGTSWPRPPTSIPLPYAVNAGYLWQNGEDYHFDPLSDPPWEIGLIASPIPRAQRLATAEVLTDHALSYLNPEQYSPGSPVQVTLEITPPTGTQAYAVEETPPEGWAVSDISDSGTFAPQSNQIRWGLFFDDGFRSLTYRITPPAQASDTQTLHGQAAFDQTTVPIGGQRNLPPAGSLCGDANRSGATDIIDALWISRYSAGLNPQPFDEVAADVQVPPNGVSIVDALLCARFAAGLQTTGTCLGAP